MEKVLKVLLILSTSLHSTIFADTKFRRPVENYMQKLVCGVLALDTLVKRMMSLVWHLDSRYATSLPLSFFLPHSSLCLVGATFLPVEVLTAKIK